MNIVCYFSQMYIFVTGLSQTGSLICCPLLPLRSLEEHREECGEFILAELKPPHGKGEEA